MKREFINKFGKVSSSVKPAVLRYFCHDLTGDSSGRIKKRLIFMLNKQLKWKTLRL